MDRLKVLDECPEWPLVRIVNDTHWTDPIVEFFHPTAYDGPPMHMHVYKREKARKGFAEGRFVIPPTVVSVSYEK